MQQKLHMEGNLFIYEHSICCIRTQWLRFFKRYFFERRFLFAARREYHLDAFYQVRVERFVGGYAIARKQKAESAETAQIHAFAH